MNLHRAYINWGHVDSWYWITWNNFQTLFSWNKQGQIIYKDGVIENLNMICLLPYMIKMKSNNTNQIWPFVSSLFAKAIVEYSVPLEWIKNEDVLTMVKVLKSQMKNSRSILP